MPLTFYAGWIVLALALCGGAYAVVAAVLVSRVLHRPPARLPDPPPAVTILKPLHGDEPGLEAALTSFLDQSYAAPVQVVFGVRDATDPARNVAEGIKQRFPDRDIAIVVDPQVHGPNGKISNVVNMMKCAAYDVLVLADSDIAVGPEYLGAVVATLSRPDVGVVSCLYTGRGVTNFWSRVAAMGIGYQFLPNAAVGIASGMAHPCFGSTIAMRRSTLAAIGGFDAFAFYLADDFEIGRAARAKGLALAYPALCVRHNSSETSLAELAGHELRWARTIRVIDPAGHWGSFITHALPLGLIGAAFLGFSPAACVGLAGLLAARLFLKARIDHIVGSSAGPAWMLPARDVLSFGLFIASLFGNAVHWRGSRLRVGKSGAMSQS